MEKGETMQQTWRACPFHFFFRTSSFTASSERVRGKHPSFRFFFNPFPILLHRASTLSLPPLTHQRTNETCVLRKNHSPRV